MATTQALIIVFLILLIGLFLLNISLYMARLMMRKDVSAKVLFKNFRQKMWMTFGLGAFFSCLYFLAILRLAAVDDPSARLNFFHLVYTHPIAFIYLGLLTFLCVSVGIYLARMAIIYWCNRSGH